MAKCDGHCGRCGGCYQRRGVVLHRKCACGDCGACRRRAKKARTAEEKQAETESALFRLPPGEWRSHGEYLDYEPWPARERFRVLDIMIAAGLGERRTSRKLLSGD